MAQSVAGLLYRITSDSTQARTDLSSLTGLLQSSLHSVTNLFSGIANDSKSASAGTSAAFKTLAADTKIFESQLNSAAKSMGVLPSKAREIVEAFSKLGSDKEKFQFGIQFQNFDPTKIAALGTQNQSLIAQQQALATASAETGAAFDIEAVAGVALGAVVAVAVLSVVALTAASFELAKSASDAGSKLHDLSTQSGLSVETLSALTLAAKENGTTIETVTQATGLLERRMQEAAAGNKQFQQSLALIGVTNPTEQLKDMDGTIRTVIQTIGGFNNDGARTALVLDNLGRGGKALIPIIDDVGGDFDKLTERTNKLGFGFTTDGAAAADTFGDRMTDLGLAVEGLKNKFGAEFFDVFTKLVVGLTDAAVAAQPFIVAMGQGAVGAISDFTDEAVQLKPALDAVLSVLHDLIPQTGLVDEGFFSIKRNMKDLREIINFLGGGVTFLQDIVELAGAAIEKVMDAVKVGIDKLKKGLREELGLSTVAVDADIKLLTDDIGKLDARLGEGLKNNRKFIGDLAAVAKAAADAQAKIASGDVSAIPGTFEDLAAHTTKPSAAGLKQKPDKTPKDETAQEDKARLAILELGEKKAELIFKVETEALKLELSQRLISNKEFADRSILIDQERLTKHLKFLFDELVEVEKSHLKQRDKDVKTAQLAQQIEEAKTASVIKQLDIKETLRLKDFEAEKAHQAKLLDLANATDAAKINRIKSAAAIEAISAVAAEQQIAVIDAAIFERRKAALDKQKTTAADPNESRAIDDQLAALELARVESVEASTRRITAARIAETQAQKRFQADILKSEIELTAAQIEAERLRIDELERHAVTPTRKRIVIDDRAANEAAAEEQRHARAQESLSNQETELLLQAKTDDDVLAVQSLFDQKFEDEALRSANALGVIAQTRKEQQAAVSGDGPLGSFLGPEFNATIEDGGSKFEALGATVSSVMANMKSQTTNAAGFMSAGIGAVSNAMGTMLTQFILTGKTGPAAFRQLVAGAIAELAKLALFNGIYWTAQGIADTFWDPPKAAGDFAAAAEFFAAAALGAVIGRAIAGNSAGGSGSAGAGTFGGKSTNDQPADTKVKFGDVTGKQNNNTVTIEFSKIGRGIFGDDLQKLHDAALAQTNATALQTAAIEKQAFAAVALVTKLSSISPVDSLTVAAEQAPDVIGRAVLENHDRDGNFTGRVARALQLN